MVCDPFTPLITQKIKVLKKMKKTHRDIILHKCTINDNHMMYGSCDMKRDTQNFLSFWTVFYPFTPLTTWKIKIKFFFLSIWTIFCPFTSLTTQKIKILKNWKKHIKISSFYLSVQKIMILYTILFHRYDA